jgi:hypothetical protein
MANQPAGVKANGVKQAWRRESESGGNVVKKARKRYES